MTAEPRDWQASPHALEFLPEEIAMLAAGTMVLCSECQWSRPTEGSCGNCQIHDIERDRNGGARHDAAPPDAPR